MLISKTVQDFLTSRRIPFRKLLRGSATDGITIPDHERVRAVLLCDGTQPLLAVFPANNGLDFEALVEFTKRPLKVATAREFDSRLHGLSNLHLPPLGDMFGINMVLDESLRTLPWLRIAGGEDGVSYLLSNNAFWRLVERANVHSFSRPAALENQPLSPSVTHSSVYQLLGQVALGGANVGYAFKDNDIIERLKEAKLPPIPAVAQRIIALKAADDFELIDLVRAIESDPATSAHILRLARSAYYSYAGRIGSIRDAIFHVLGADVALHAALGIAVGHVFTGPMEGPLGLPSHWRHAVRAATTAQVLASATSVQPRIQHGTAYLVGLLHDAGFLLMAQSAPGEYKLLNKMMQAKSSLTTADAEQRVFGVSHAELGRRLFTEWNMPEELIVATAYHHDPEYNGPHCAYAHLIWLTDRLLRTQEKTHDNADDGSWGDIPPSLLESLGLETYVLDDCLALLNDKGEILDGFAVHLAA